MNATLTDTAEASIDTGAGDDKVKLSDSSAGKAEVDMNLTGKRSRRFLIF
ncbi:MAG: hypothetical protein IKH57_20310 [Clostridia bacterium]|nr:hypothetical protein [Clostridia bacterium]